GTYSAARRSRRNATGRATLQGILIGAQALWWRRGTTCVARRHQASRAAAGYSCSPSNTQSCLTAMGAASGPTSVEDRRISHLSHTTVRKHRGLACTTRELADSALLERLPSRLPG